MLETAKRIPGVEYATLTISVPFWSNEGRGLWVPGVDSVNRRGNFMFNTGSPDYFKTMGTRILKAGPSTSATAPAPRRCWWWASGWPRRSGPARTP